MRFQIEVHFCVEADSVEEVDDLQSRAEDAAVEAVGGKLIKDPEWGSISGGSIEGLDAESVAALRAADE
jgi:hypothetical protein